MSDVCVSEHTQEVFLRCAHINVHIIACLRARKALDRFQVSQLSGEKSLIKRNQMVYEWIESTQSFYATFLWVMENNEQEHVSNLLKGIQDGPHIPLSPLRYNRLESITPKLMLIIRNDEELIAKLRAKRAISEIDRQDITQVSKEYKRNWNLIEAILRRSDYAFDCFEQALRETLQDNVAQYLRQGQIISVHVNTTQPEKDEVMSELLNATILEESNDALSSDEKILTTINECNIKPVVTKPGQSIVFFFYCKTADNMITFTELFISGDLQNMIEIIMNRVWSKIDPENTEQLKARLSLDDAEILAVEKFSGIADWMPVELEETTSGSRILYSAETQTEQHHEDVDSDDYDWTSALLEEVMSSSIPRSSAESHWDETTSASSDKITSASSDKITSASSDRSSDSGVYGWSKGERKIKKTEEVKRKQYGLDSLAYTHTGKGGKLHDIQEYVDAHATSERRTAHSNPVLPLRKPFTLKDIYPTDIYNEEFHDLRQKLEQTLKEKNTLTKLLEEHRTLIGELLEKYKSDPVLIQTIRTKAAEEQKKSIVGLTILDKEMFVVNQVSSEVEVYDLMNFSFSRRWNLKELICPMDIGSCNRSKCLFIFDSKGFGRSSEILRVDPNGNLIKKWSTRGDYGCLSVTDESLVILTVFEKNKLNIYSSDGQLIREVNLSTKASISYPSHVVQLTNGNFVVSHGFSGDDMHGVCLVDADGKLKKSYGGKRGSAIGQMNLPFHLTVDGDGFVMVVDRFNRRVLLLDSDLKLKREILSKEKHGLRDPWRIVLDESNGRLFVADNELNNERILIFSLNN